MKALQRLAKGFAPNEEQPRHADTRWWVPVLAMGDTPGNITFAPGPAPQWAEKERANQLAKIKAREN